MSTLRETFCLDAPVDTDLQAVYLAFQAAHADMVLDRNHLVAFTTTAPDGCARLVVSGDRMAGAAGALTALLEEFGHGRAAVATDWADQGARWTVLTALHGTCRTAYRATQFGAGDERAAQLTIDEHWDGVDPRHRDVRGPVALATVAAFYGVDPAVLAEVESAPRSVDDPFPWWRALDLPELSDAFRRPVTSRSERA